MTCADEFQQVRPDLFFWQAYEPAVKSELSCCARRLGDRLFFIDPIPLAAAALEELTSLAPPAAILLTSGNHARAAAAYRQRFSIPILAHADAVTDLSLAVDQTLADGETALETFAVTRLPGAGPGEIAFTADGVLHLGDALIHLESPGFTFLPDKYCVDPAEMRLSLRKLLRFPFEVMTFAHGLPLVSRARQRLVELLA